MTCYKCESTTYNTRDIEENFCANCGYLLDQGIGFQVIADPDMSVFYHKTGWVICSGYRSRSDYYVACIFQVLKKRMRLLESFVVHPDLSMLRKELKKNGLKRIKADFDKDFSAIEAWI